MSYIDSFVYLKKEMLFLDSKFQEGNDLQKEYISYHSNRLIEIQEDLMEDLNQEEFDSLPFGMVSLTSEDVDLFKHHEEKLNTFALLDKTIDEIKSIISLRLYANLKRNKINTVQELVSKSIQELYALPRMGNASIQEIKSVFADIL